MYIYRPRHPWRHGYRRERLKRAVLLLFKVLFTAEVLILGRRYIEVRTDHTVLEHEIPGHPGQRGDVVGISIDRENGDVFWFRQYQELVRDEP